MTSAVGIGGYKSSSPFGLSVQVDDDVKATVAGFLGAAVVLGVLLLFVGVDQVVTTVLQARPEVFGLVLLVSMGWLLAWGLSLRTVLASLGIHISVSKSFLVYAAATFANNVTPFGQAGGEPFSALLISRVTDSEYETGLAAIASVDALNLAPSAVLATVGLGFFAVTATLGDRLEIVAVTIFGLTVALGSVLYLIYRYRDHAERVAAGLATPIARTVTKLLPGREPPTRESVVTRIEGFFSTIDRIADDRRRVALAVSFSTLGWLALSCCLWLSLFALGHRVAIAAALLAVPVGSIAAVTPLPGGLGGIEAVLVAILVATTGLPLSVVSAGVVLHRTATYWLPVLLGGGAASAFGVSARP